MAELTTSDRTLRRLVRVGETPVLEVAVTYPVLRTDRAPAEAVERFNEGYRTVAEGFLRWGLGEPAREAEADFAAAGPRAVYTFDRRLAICHMTISLPEELPEGCSPRRLWVARTVELGSRRGTLPTRRSRGRDVWFLPSLFLASL